MGQIVTGTFEAAENLEDARTYLLANEFSEQEITISDMLMSIDTSDDVEAQEAYDVLVSYGAVNIKLPGLKT
jgi:hypothetical protein